MLVLLITGCSSPVETSPLEKSLPRATATVELPTPDPDFIPTDHDRPSDSRLGRNGRRWTG